MMSPKILALDLLIADDNYEEGTLQLLARLRPQWNQADVIFKVFTQ